MTFHLECARIIDKSLTPNERAASAKACAKKAKAWDRSLGPTPLARLQGAVSRQAIVVVRGKRNDKGYRVRRVPNAEEQKQIIRAIAKYL